LLSILLLFEVGLLAARFVGKKAVADSGDGDYRPPTDAEQNGELDRIEAEERSRSGS